MKQKLKAMMYPLIATGIALLFIVLLELPYMNTYGIGFSGYDMLRLYQGSYFLQFIISFFQFFFVVGVLLLLNVGILGILQKTGVVEIKKSLKGWTYNKLVGVILLVVASLSVVEMLFVIIHCAKYSIYIGVGAILNPILLILAFVAYVVLPKNLNKPEVKQSVEQAEKTDETAQTQNAEEPVQVEDYQTETLPQGEENDSISSGEQTE